MTFLRAARNCLEDFLPGLDKALNDVPLLELEQPGSDALAMFKQVHGPALLVPKEFGGMGASLSEAVHIQRAIGSRSPSLAVATTMHHFSVASLVELTATGGGFEWAMLEAIATNNWLMSSGFAEGRTGQHILSPTMRAKRVDGGLLVQGSKKPCSLTWSMDLMSASVAVENPDGGPPTMAVILIPADSEGIERKRFWESWVLAGAESDEIILRDVHVPDALVFYPAPGDSMDPIQSRGFTWFELLIAASYVGVASGLAERVIVAGRGTAEDRAVTRHRAGSRHRRTAVRRLRALVVRGPRRRVGPSPLRPLRGGTGHRAGGHGGGDHRRGHGVHRVVRHGLPAGGQPRPCLPSSRPLGGERRPRPPPGRRSPDPLTRKAFPWTHTTCS